MYKVRLELSHWVIKEGGESFMEDEFSETYPITPYERGDLAIQIKITDSKFVDELELFVSGKENDKGISGLLGGIVNLRIIKGELNQNLNFRYCCHNRDVVALAFGVDERLAIFITIVNNKEA